MALQVSLYFTYFRPHQKNVLAMMMKGEVTAKIAVSLKKKTQSSIKFYWVVFTKKAQPFEARIKCPMWSAADWNSNEGCKMVALTGNSWHLSFWASNCAFQIHKHLVPKG